MRGGWGPGASPVLHEERLYFVNDNERESSVVALDTSTGDEMWRVPREAWGRYEKDAVVMPLDLEAELRRWGAGTPA